MVSKFTCSGIFFPLSNSCGPQWFCHMEAQLQQLNSKNNLFPFFPPIKGNLLVLYSLFLHSRGYVFFFYVMRHWLLWGAVGSWTYTHRRCFPMPRTKEAEKYTWSTFKHRTCQFERHLVLTVFTVLFLEGSWLLWKPCKPHWNSIEVQSGSDTSSIPMNGRDVEFHIHGLCLHKAFQRGLGLPGWMACNPTTRKRVCEDQRPQSYFWTEPLMYSEMFI